MTTPGRQLLNRIFPVFKPLIKPDPITQYEELSRLVVKDARNVSFNRIINPVMIGGVVWVFYNADITITDKKKKLPERWEDRI